MATPKAQRTWTPRAGQYTRTWRVVDANGQTLGRLASQIAGYLRGKHLPTFAGHMDLGDFVVVVNASRIRVTGNKLRQKMYYRHSGYPGGFKSVVLGDVLERHPDRVIKHAVKGMLPHNALGRKLLSKLKVYAGPTHPHRGQVAESAAPPKAAPAPPRKKAAPAVSDEPEVAATVASEEQPADAEVAEKAEAVVEQETQDIATAETAETPASEASADERPTEKQEQAK